MVDLIAKTPCAGLLPFENDAVSIVEVELGTAYAVAAFDGQSRAVDKALGAQFGLALPSPNGAIESDLGRAIWIGPNRALVVVRDVPELGAAGAVTEQGDGIAAVRLAGAGATEVLARLAPIDLRLSRFPVGETRRTMINHMMGSIIREGDNVFELHVMRSMAETLVAELKEAAMHVAGRSR